MSEERKMTEEATADTPLRAAAKALIDADPTMSGHHESHVQVKMPYARAALTAALKVRWDGRNAYLGKLYVGEAQSWKTVTNPRRADKPFRAWLDGGKEIGWFATLAEAQAAVERAVLEAILGETTSG